MCFWGREHTKTTDFARTPYVTSASDKLSGKDPVPVTGGIFTAALASKTVTTFVGK